MNYLVLTVMLLGSAICFASAMALTKSPTACDMLNEKHALALVWLVVHWGRYLKTKSSVKGERLRSYQRVRVFPKRI